MRWHVTAQYEALLQVESHDSRESAWFVYENKVYDGTKFLTDHPGGPESILIVAGQVGF